MDQRQFHRFDYEVEVDVETENNFFVGFVKNISSGGLFIATMDPLARGAKLKIRMSLPGLPEPAEVACEVRWVRATRADQLDVPPGMGVAFLDLQPDVAKAINDFLRQRDPLFYD